MHHIPLSLRSLVSLGLLGLTGLILPVNAAPPSPPGGAFELVPHVRGKVVLPNGSPAAGVRVACGRYHRADGAFQPLYEASTDEKGIFSLPLTRSAVADTQGLYVLYLTSSTGMAMQTLSSSDAAKPIVLQPFTKVRIRLVDAAGNPLAHVPIAPQYFLSRYGEAPWTDAVSHAWSEKTDDDGWATFSQMPQSYTFQLGINDDRFARLGEEARISLAAAAETPDRTIHLVPGCSLSGVVRYSTTGKPAAGVTVSASQIGAGNGWGIAKTDANGQYHMTRLSSGAYSVVFRSWQSPAGAESEWTAKARSVTLAAAGDSLSGIDLSLIHGALITGRVTDTTTGKPLANVIVYSNGPDHPQESHTGASATTGSDGTYRLRVAPGDQSLNVSIPGQYSQYDATSHSRNVQVAEGTTKQVDFQVKGPEAPRPVHGIVLGANGKPVSGAQVIAIDRPEQDFPTITTDAKGRFVFAAPGLIASQARLYAYSGDSATRKAGQVSGNADVVLKLVPHTRQPVQGIVKDTTGQPIAHAKIELTHWYNDNTGLRAGETYTDAQGRYIFHPVFGDARYSVHATADGYTDSDSDLQRDMARTPSARPMEIPALTLIRLDGFVAGTVVDPQGNPVAGAQVADFEVWDSKPISTHTDDQGHFRLEGVPRISALLDVSAAQARTASLRVPSGHEDIRITVKSQAERDAENQKFFQAMHGDGTNHGDGTDANLLLKTAKAKAAASGRQVFLVFHASWCGPCFVLHRFLTDPKVKPVMDAHFVVQDIDIWEHGKNNWENPGGVALYQKYSPLQGVPYFVVMAPSGKPWGDSRRKGQNMGFPAEPEEVQSLLRTLRSASPSLTDKEIAILRDGLKRVSPYQ